MGESVGKYLKELRESKGVTLEEIAEETKIQKRYLEDLENDEFESLPGDAYVKGFIRNYSAAMNINSDEVMAIYKKMKINKNQMEEELSEQDIVIERAKVKKLNILVIIILITLFAAGIYMFLAGKISIEKMENKGTTSVKEENIKMENQQNVEKIKSINENVSENMGNEKKDEVLNKEESGITETAISDKIKKIEITIKGDSWLTIKDGNEKIFDGLAKAGETKIIRSEEPVYVKIGKVSNVAVKFNGELLELKGNENEVYKNTWE